MTPLDVLDDLQTFLTGKMRAYSGQTVDGKAICGNVLPLAAAGR